VEINGGLTDYANFQEFWKAFVLMISVSSGESWSVIMHSCAVTDDVLINCVDDPTYDEIQANGGEPNGCGTWISYIYFV
jgi:hypothetical protein